MFAKFATFWPFEAMVKLLIILVHVAIYFVAPHVFGIGLDKEDANA